MFFARRINRLYLHLWMMAVYRYKKFIKTIDD